MAGARRTLPALALSFVLACDKPSDATPGAPTTATTATIATTTPAAAAPSGPVVLSDAIPAEAFAVAVVRLPSSWLDVVRAFDPFASTADDLAPLRKDIDDTLQARLGLTISDVKGASAFVIDMENVGVVLDGVGGAPKGAPVSDGIVAIEGEPDLHGALLGAQLVLGTPRAVAAAVAASKDAGKRLSGNTAMTAWLAANSDGASAAVAVDFTRTPPKLLREVVGIERGFASFGATRFVASIEAPPTVIATLAGQADRVMKDAIAEMKKAADQMRKSDDTLVALGAALASHQARRLETLVVPVATDGRLTVTVPLETNNATALVALAGIGAAIAIPAFTKYLRRSKGSEARVHLARMFDAAAAHFDEEQVARTAGAAAVESMATHQCPNDGRLSGTAGVTPPLSLDCSAGPDGKCVPSLTGDKGPGIYDGRLWTDNPVWNSLDFQMEEAHAFHYDFKWTNGADGFGMCQFTAQAFADLDGDGVFSTYERAGAADRHGMNGAAGLYIDQEVE